VLLPDLAGRGRELASTVLGIPGPASVVVEDGKPQRTTTCLEGLGDPGVIRGCTASPRTGPARSSV
jgi:hypothetical protein